MVSTIEGFHCSGDLVSTATYAAACPLMNTAAGLFVHVSLHVVVSGVCMGIQFLIDSFSF